MLSLPTETMRVILLVVLHLCITLAHVCNKNDATLSCTALEWTDLPSADTAANLSAIERLVLTQVSGTHSWQTESFSAVNFVSIHSGILLPKPFRDLVRLPHLTILHVSNTPAECWKNDAIDLFNSSALERLAMSSSLNCDDELEFSLNKNMHELELSDNWLGVFPRIHGGMLTYLRLSANNLHNIGNLSSLPNLMELDMSVNPLGEIPIDAFHLNTELVRLNLSSTSLESVSFQAPFLEQLTLTSNHITHVKRSFFKGMPYLTLVDLSDNELTELSDEFDDLTKLCQLHLSHNYLREIKPETFSQLQTLEVLKLDSNSLTSLPELSEIMPSLHLLDISNNSITILDSKFFSHVPFLATLHASFNGMQNMDDAAVAMHNLKKLIVNGNNLHVDSRTLASMEQLNTLDMSYNGLTISLDVLANNMALKDVNLMSNNISDICGEQQLPLQLGSVNIAYNQISNLACLEGLTSLNITGNPVTCGENLKLNLREALDNFFDSEETTSDTERIVQDNDEKEWVVVYKSVCSDDPFVVPDPIPPVVMSVENDGDSSYDNSSEDYDDSEDEMEVKQSQRDEGVPIDDDEDDDDDDIADIEDINETLRMRQMKSTIYVFMCIAVVGFAFLSLVGVVYFVIAIGIRRKRALRSQHVSAYEQLRSPVYNETTSRVPNSNFSANLGRVLTENPIAGAFKTENMASVFGKLRFKATAPEDELEAKMIPGDSTQSLA